MFIMVQTICFNTCMQINQCLNCNSGTCYDDGMFIKALMERINDNLSVDQNQVFWKWSWSWCYDASLFDWKIP